MSSGEHQAMLRDDADDRFCLREQLAAARDADERPILLRIADLVLGVEGGHPDEAAPAAGDLGKVLDRRRVDAADRQVQVDAAEYLETRRGLAGKIGQPRGGVVVVLEND